MKYNVLRFIVKTHRKRTPPTHLMCGNRELPLYGYSFLARPHQTTRYLSWLVVIRRNLTFAISLRNLFQTILRVICLFSTHFFFSNVIIMLIIQYLRSGSSNFSFAVFVYSVVLIQWKREKKSCEQIIEFQMFWAI